MDSEGSTSNQVRRPDLGERIRVLAVAQYPPVEGVPTGDGPINFALSKYAQDAGADLYWVFTREPATSPHWRSELSGRAVRYLEPPSQFRYRVAGISEALVATPRLCHPRRIALKATEGGVLRAAIEQAIALHQPDLIFLASPNAALLCPSRLNLPVAYNSMDSLTFAFANGSYGRKTGMSWALKRWALHRFDRFTCADKDLVFFVSEREAASAPYVGPGRAAVVPNGADLQRFRAATHGDESIQPTVTFQGSHSYPPNLRAIRLIAHEIAPLVWAKMPGVCFRFVGVGNEELAGQIVPEDERLNFVGYVSDLGEELRRAWVVVAPMEDGAGIKNKVLDALASGVPVVGFPEAFSGMKPASDCAIEARSPDELADAAVSLLADDARRRRAAADARVHAATMGWPQQATRYVGHWRSIVAHDSMA